MPTAARKTDPIAHSREGLGIAAGAGVGAALGAVAIGVAVVASAPVSVPVLLLTVGGAACAGATYGGRLGKSDYIKDNLGGFPTGNICTGSANVKINSLNAARAGVDTVECAGTPPNFLSDHNGKAVISGSATVLVNGMYFARVEEKIQCGSWIDAGSPDVSVGGPSASVAEPDAEVPKWVYEALHYGGLLCGAGGAYLGAKWVGVAVFAAISSGARIVGGTAARITAALGGGEIAQEIAANIAGTLFSRRASVLPIAQKGVSSPRASARKTGLEPVDLASGSVVDSEIDIDLPGVIPLVWQRNYNSAQAQERAALGRGGWTHSFDQWIECLPGITIFRDEGGRDIYFPVAVPGTNAFHRGERLLLTAQEAGAFEVHSLETRLTRVFAPLDETHVAVLRAVRDTYGNEISLYYSGRHLSRIVDTAGREIYVTSGPGGKVARLDVRVDGKIEQWVNYTYTDRGELASVVDVLGNVGEYAYDIESRMSKKTLKNGVSFYYEYDERTGWCCRSFGDGGLHRGRIRVDGEKRITYLEENEEPRILHWNDDGLVVREETPDGILIGTWEYDRDLYLVAEANGAGETTRHEYDARGNRVRTIEPAGNVTEYSYSDDQPTRRVGPDKLTTRYWYGQKGELRQIAYPSGAQYRLEHDERGRLVSVDDGENVLRRFGHDERHDCVLEVDARGATTQYAYDPLGRAIGRVDALGRVTLVEYDALGRAIAIKAPDGTVTRREYDAYGNVTQEVDALGGATEMEYSGTGKLSRMVRPDGTVWHLRYDGTERLRQIFNPHGELYAFDYDTAGRVISEQTFDGRTLKYAYSDAGRVSSIVEPDGATRELLHDKLGSVLRDKTADGEITFERDNLGRLQRAVLQERSGKVVTAFRRDELGLVVEERQNERAIQYRHDRFGRRVERVLSDGSTTRYGYDPDHALSWLEHDGRRFSMERDVLGREVRRAGADGVEIRNAYDVMDRLAERAVVERGGHTVSSQRSWKYDELGRVVGIGDDRWGATTYRYDSIGQLLQAKRRSYCEVFHYDATGSLRKIFEGLKGPRRGKAWDTAPGNLLKRSDRAEYEYDARGRRVKKVALVDGGGARAGEVTQYRWDDRDRLREVVKASGERVLFTYDAFGRRVRKEVLPATGGSGRRVVEFVWDGDELAADLDDERGARVFVHEPGTFVPALQAEQGEVFAVVNDHLGMPKELVDGEGSVAWSAAHSAWGRVVETYRDETVRREREVESPFRLLGQYADEETGLCYTRFRYFDAETGRWCSPDPLGILGGKNLLGFDGSAINDIDPLGLSSTSGGSCSTNAAKSELPDNTIVCRGGTCTAKRFEEGRGVTVDTSGKLQGVSVNAGDSLAQATRDIPHSQVGTTTAGEVRRAGGQVIPTPNDRNPTHATMSGITSQQAEQLFTPTVPNPNK